MSELKADITINDLNEQDRKPIAVKWEQSKGQIFAILYRRMIEVYDMTKATAGDKPCSRTILDFATSSFDFINANQLLISDDRGHLIIISNVTDADTLSMKIYSTKFTRLRELQVFDELFVAALTHVNGEGKLVLWQLDQLLNE